MAESCEIDHGHFRSKFECFVIDSVCCHQYVVFYFLHLISVVITFCVSLFFQRTPKTSYHLCRLELQYGSDWCEYLLQSEVECNDCILTLDERDRLRQQRRLDRVLSLHRRRRNIPHVQLVSRRELRLGLWFAITLRAVLFLLEYFITPTIGWWNVLSGMNIFYHQLGSTYVKHTYHECASYYVVSFQISKSQLSISTYHLGKLLHQN